MINYTIHDNKQFSYIRKARDYFKKIIIKKATNMNNRLNYHSYKKRIPQLRAIKVMMLKGLKRTKIARINSFYYEQIAHDFKIMDYYNKRLYKESQKEMIWTYGQIFWCHSQGTRYYETIYYKLPQELVFKINKENAKNKRLKLFSNRIAQLFRIGHPFDVQASFSFVTIKIMILSIKIDNSITVIENEIAKRAMLERCPRLLNLK